MLAVLAAFAAWAPHHPAVLRPQHEAQELARGRLALQQHVDATPVGSCNLCARNFTLLLATGRSGSTSVLEALNSLPGVNLRGENHASLWAAFELFRRATAEGPNAAGGPAYEHGPLSEEQLLCTLQDFFVAFDPPSALAPHASTVLGFKELIMPASMANMSGMMRSSSQSEMLVEHLVDSPDDWLRFAQRLFPCARVVFNYRRDTIRQANSTFFGNHHVTHDVLDRLNARFHEWHERFERADGSFRSYLMPLEDFTPEGATELAHFLGFPSCTFRALPHANEPDSYIPDDSASAPSFHADYEHVDVRCTSSAGTQGASEYPYPLGTVRLDTQRATSTAQTPARAPKFFLHEDLGEPFGDVEERMRALHAVGSLDQHMPITHAEHLHDMYLLDGLRNHPQRTYDEASADLHFTSALLGSSAMLATDEPSDGASHWARVEAFTERLTANPSFRAGRPFYLQMSIPTGLGPPPLSRAAARDPLFERLMDAPSANVILGTTDPAYIGLRTALMNGGFARYAMLPYRAHGLLAQAQSIGETMSRTRSVDIFFHGNCDREDNGLRSTMLDAVDRLRPSRRVDVQSVVITGVTAQWSNASYVQAAVAITNRTAMQMRDAELCLCPAGDTSSSRRLYDALAAGCVPVIIVRAGGNFFNHVASPSNVSNNAALWLHAQRYLPFPDVIDWPSIAFFWVDTGAADGMTGFLSEISSPAMDASRQMMRAAGRQAFNRHLDTEFSSRDVISSLLANEAVQMARPEERRQTATAKPVAASGAPPQCLGAGSSPSGGRAVFIKTHKTASGSIFSILARAAVMLNLNVAVPPPRARDNARSWGWPGRFPDGLADGQAAGPNERYLSQGAPFDLLIHHANLDSELMSRSVPGAPFVTILRDSASQFVSAWDYFYGGVNNPWGGRGLRAFGIANVSSGLPMNATIHLSGGRTESMPINTWTERAAFVARVDELGLDLEMSASLMNPNARQLGWPQRLPDGTTGNNVTRWLRTLDEQFGLIMVQERFNDSLLLLGRCLGLDPVRFQLVPPPVESVAHKQVEHAQPLTAEDREAIHRLSHVDMALYDHASARFDEQIRGVLAEEDSARRVEVRDEMARTTIGAAPDALSRSSWWTAFTTTGTELDRLSHDWESQCDRQAHSGSNASGDMSQCDMWRASEVAISTFLAR